MVLESLLSPPGAIRRPGVVFLMGFFYATIAVFLSMWVFKDYASMVLVFLTVLALVPLFMQFMDSEELADLLMNDERKVLWQHAKVIGTFVSLFLGMSLAYAIWFVALPNGIATFSVQSQTIASLRQGATGAAASGGLFLVILVNNLKVLMFCILFSFLYGAGAIFILTWNSSVIGVALGNFYQQGVGAAASSGATGFATYAGAAGMSAVRYLIHGIPEITAYFVGGLAGGVLSVAIIKHHWERTKMDKVLLDTSDLIILGVVILVIAAVIETWITPMLV